jgi:hypothetical protein
MAGLMQLGMRETISHGWIIAHCKMMFWYVLIPLVVVTPLSDFDLEPPRQMHSLVISYQIWLFSLVFDDKGT